MVSQVLNEIRGLNLTSNLGSVNVNFTEDSVAGWASIRCQAREATTPHAAFIQECISELLDVRMFYKGSSGDRSGDCGGHVGVMVLRNCR